MRHADQREEESLDVDQIAEHVAHDHVVEGRGDRQTLDVSADEVEIRVALPRVEQRREREVDADPTGGLEGSEQGPVATAEVEHGRAGLHLVADHPVEIVVVVAMPGSRGGTARRDLVEVPAEPTARAGVEVTRAAGCGVGRWSLLAFHEGSNDRLIPPRVPRGHRMASKRALITGITGQDGSYLAELLLSKHYEVHGIMRRSSSFNTGRLDHLYTDPHEPGGHLFLHYGDLVDSTVVSRIVREVVPDEVYHLGAQSHVRVSYDIPEYTGDVTALGTTRLLEAIRQEGSPARFYQASSSEMFGTNPDIPSNEQSRFYPASPYAAAKVYGYWMAVNYREAYGMFCTNGILFNHESERRGETFVTRKIARGLVDILAGRADVIHLGKLESERDWGHAADYVEAMWLMMQTDEPDDYVIATGESHSVQEFLEEAFGYVGLDWERHVRQDPRYFRPVDPPILVGDATKARTKLGWKPKVTFEELVHSMVDAELRASGLERPVPHGSATPP
jgi:GDPmannose 4,6-dehydratase